MSISDEELQEVYKIIMDDAHSVLRKANIVSLVVSNVLITKNVRKPIFYLFVFRKRVMQRKRKKPKSFKLKRFISMISNRTTLSHLQWFLCNSGSSGQTSID